MNEQKNTLELIALGYGFYFSKMLPITEKNDQKDFSIRHMENPA